MAIYHLSCKIINRSSGRSSVAAAAYRAGEKILNKSDDMTHDYSNRKDVVYTEILTPANVPKWAKTRTTLWNEVEKVEKRKDAQTAREVEIALPVELTLEQQKELIKNYSNENFVKNGMIADIALHQKDKNPHAHIMLTMRNIDGDGFKNKNRNWNSKDFINSWRENWAKSCNKELEKYNISAMIDNRSYEAQGIDKLPTVHLGMASKMEKKGKKTEKGDYNREVNEKNENLKNYDDKIKILEKKMNDLKAEKQLETIRQKIQEYSKDLKENTQKQREEQNKMQEVHNKKSKITIEETKSSKTTEFDNKQSKQNQEEQDYNNWYADNKMYIQPMQEEKQEQPQKRKLTEAQRKRLSRIHNIKIEKIPEKSRILSEDERLQNWYTDNKMYIQPMQEEKQEQPQKRELTEAQRKRLNRIHNIKIEKIPEKSRILSEDERLQKR